MAPLLQDHYCVPHVAVHEVQTERAAAHRLPWADKFRTILLGQGLRIYTNTKKLTCKKFNTDRLLRWMIIIEEYDPFIEYIQGSKNIVAAELSIFTINGNHETTHESTYKKEIVS